MLSTLPTEDSDSLDPLVLVDDALPVDAGASYSFKMALQPIPLL